MRKSIIFTLLILVTAFSLYAQKEASYLFFSDASKPFHVLLSGITQNETALTKMLIVNVPEEALSMQAKIIFEDESLGEFKLQLPFKDDQVFCYEVISSPKVAVVPRDSTVLARMGPLTNIIHVYQAGSSATQVSFDPIATTVILREIQGDSGQLVISSVPVEAGDIEIEPEIVDYSGPTGCEFPMGDERFVVVLSTINMVSNQKLRLEFIKREVKGKCLRSDQCVLVLGSIENEASRLEAAKAVYPVLWDRANIMTFKPLFPTSNLWSAFMTYINTYDGQ